MNSSSSKRFILFSLLAFLIFYSQAFATEKAQRTVETYHAPDIILTDQDGEDVKFTELVNQDRPVLLDFIYATCTTICPILSASYSNLQRKLGEQSNRIQLISISIDPEHDQPLVMKEYLERYQAKEGWSYLTGNRQDIDQAMHAFDAYVANKMSHYPLTLIKVPGKPEWVRLYGLIGTKELIGEIEQLYGPLQIKDNP